MAERVTILDLERRISHLNNLMGFKRRYIKSKAEYTGKQLELSQAYGGVKLVLVGKGERNVSGGYGTKRELYEFLEGMTTGISTYKNRNKIKKS